MKLKIFGPTGRVTGSCAMLYDEQLGFRTLVDCGMQQGEGDESWNREPFPFDPASINRVLLTHAHVDHCGLLPKLVREGFRGDVVCTPETAALARVQLESAARLGDHYDMRDVRRVRFRPYEGAFGQRFPIGRDVWAQFYRTAHILGSVAIRVSWGPRDQQRSIVFSGDLGTNVDGAERFPLLRHVMKPDPSTFAVVESTYGGVVRPPEPWESYVGRIENLRLELVAAIARGGTVLIPAFAMDRLPAILLDLARVCALEPRVAAVPILVHRGLAAECAKVYADRIAGKDVVKGRVHSRWVSPAAYRHFGLDPTDAGHERQLEAALCAILDPASTAPSPIPALSRGHRWVDEPELGAAGPRIVLAASGMCEGGAIASYLPSVLTDPSATILLTGHVSPSSTAGRLARICGLPSAQRARLDEDLQLSDPDATRIPLSAIRASVGRLPGYSGHADQRGLLDWLFYERRGQAHRAAETVFIQHGTDDRRRALRDAIHAHDRTVNVVLPTASAREFDLDAGAPTSLDSEVEQLRERVSALERALEELRGRAA